MGPAKIRLQGAGFDLSIRLGAEPPTPSGGGPTWGEEARPERTALTSFDGVALVKLDVPVLLDGWRESRDVKPELDAILSIATGPEGQRPPDFIATGPIPYSGLRFVMGQPDFGDRAGQGGVLMRQELTLKLIEFVDPDTVTLERRDTGASGAKKAKGGSNIYTTKQDETLYSIAVKLYGLFAAQAGMAKQIGNLNGIRDVRKKLKAGLKLRLPRPAG